MQVELLIIDPQIDFCDPSGALAVPGAEQDCERLAAMIKRLKGKIDDIHVTLDSHRLLDIAHPMMWMDSNGNQPTPFTIISPDDVKNGDWLPVNPAWRTRAQDYLNQLDSNGRYPLCVWPPHCLIGSKGYGIQPSVFEALAEWESQIAMYDVVTKGSNLYTEHYSAIQADVPDPDDPSTQLNMALIQTLEDADIIAISGQALSHCVANTVIDIANNFGDDSIKKLWLVEDTCSNVPGFEQLGTDFVKDMVARGMNLTTSTSFLA
jgi:nicotinamidase/pyrazinamidase